MSVYARVCECVSNIHFTSDQMFWTAVSSHLKKIITKQGNVDCNFWAALIGSVAVWCRVESIEIAANFCCFLLATMAAWQAYDMPNALLYLELHMLKRNTYKYFHFGFHLDLFRTVHFSVFSECGLVFCFDYRLLLPLSISTTEKFKQ